MPTYTALMHMHRAVKTVKKLLKYNERLCVFGGRGLYVGYSADSVQTCDDRYTNGHFFAVRLFLMIGTLLVQSWLTSEDWYTNGRFCCFACLLTVFDDWYTVGTVKTAKMTIGILIVTC